MGSIANFRHLALYVWSHLCGGTHTRNAHRIALNSKSREALKQSRHCKWWEKAILAVSFVLANGQLRKNTKEKRETNSILHCFAPIFLDLFTHEQCPRPLQQVERGCGCVRLALRGEMSHLRHCSMQCMNLESRRMPKAKQGKIDISSAAAFPALPGPVPWHY